MCLHGDLKLFLSAMYVCPLRLLITTHVKSSYIDQLKKCYNFPVSYMALAVDILDGRGLSNKLRHGCQQKETKAILRLLRLAVLHW